ncbi:MAG: hypothetical protein ACUZ8O_14345 [Candidatus Anammoxibacter sp.]
MVTSLGDPIPRASERQLRGLVEPEASIWTRWRFSLPAGVIRIYANVRVGKGRVAEGNFTEDDRKMWLSLTQKRIDVLLEFSDKVWIVELRRVASSGALGRLMMYKQLYEEDPVLSKPVTLALVTDFKDEDVENIAFTLGVKYIVV